MTETADSLREEALYYNPTCQEVATGCCSKTCCKQVWGSIGTSAICALLAGVIVLVTPGVPLPLRVIMTWLIGMVIPFVLFYLYVVKTYGLKSIDHSQSVILFILHAILLGLYVLVTYLTGSSQLLRKEWMSLDSSKNYCMAAFWKEKNVSNLGINGTLYKFSMEEKSVTCFGIMFNGSIRPALFEEPLKLIALAMFVSKDWIADPFALLTYGFLIGTTFGVLENIKYASMTITGSEGFGESVADILNRSWTLQTFMHGNTGILQGLMMAQRKFLYQKKYGKPSCFEWRGARSTFIILLPGFLLHFINNFAGYGIASPNGTGTLWASIMLFNDIGWVVFSYYLFLTLKFVPRVNVADQQADGKLQTAFSYVRNVFKCSHDKHSTLDNPSINPVHGLRLTAVTANGKIDNA